VQSAGRFKSAEDLERPVLSVVGPYTVRATVGHVAA
jgi:hypothetical protein